ncbi:methylmalonyl-CoA mutase family protein [Cytobacillus sp. FJAT-54145]|uniref:Methylmalonyl-CoA mutase family protein n=1 Tax=Cytobacillus spartinae TaxID=3299023 RepID=A0ABW6KEG2_9BACI
MLDVQFPKLTNEQWAEKAEESLKGKSLKKLSTDTYEGIKLKPLYSREDQEIDSISEYPSQSDYRRGKNALGYVGNEWKVAQRITAQSPDELKMKLKIAIEKGQMAISFAVNEKVVDNLSTTVGSLHEEYPYFIDAKEYQTSILQELKSLPNYGNGTGVIGRDPISQLVETGSKDLDYDKWAEVIKQADQDYPNIKTILVNTTPYHNGGANAVQELAFAVSGGVNHLQHFIEQGLTADKILSKLVFHFSVGANFFMEIAKLRAARVLWSKIAEVYGGNEENRGMTISAQTSYFTKTVYDPYVNMLRAGNEAFAAVLGGVQYLHVSPFNEPEGKATPFSDRVARNTQLILKEESFLTKAIDPAGGSWYVEHLTNELVEKAWELFLMIEERGGIVEALKEGWIQEEISKVKKKRQKDIFNRKQTIVGTNMYANLQDKPLNQEGPVEHGEGMSIQQDRLSTPYEQLRRRAERLAEKGFEPEVGLVCIGKLKDHKPRADFIAGFLAPGGVKSVVSKELTTKEDIMSFIQESKLKHYCICGSNTQYNEWEFEVLNDIKQSNPEIHLYLAGKPDEEEEQWMNGGIEQFIHLRSDCYQTLSSLLNKMEGEK